MSAYFTLPNGWLAVRYYGPENAKVEIGLSISGRQPTSDWYPAFFDYNGPDRIVTIPKPAWTKSKTVISFRVFLRINGKVYR